MGEKMDIEAARNLHEDSLVFDAHIDTLLRVLDKGHHFGTETDKYNVDLPKLKAGGIDVLGCALFVHPRRFPEHKKRAMALLEAFHGEILMNQDSMAFCVSTDDIQAALEDDQVACFLGLEAGDALEGSIENLHDFHSRGVRYLTVTWINPNELGDSSTDEPKWRGLSDFGKRVVKECNRLNMLIDLSHASDETVSDVLDITEQPVVLTHSCCRALCDIPRNIGDDLLKRLADNGAVIGVNFCLTYLDQEIGQVLSNLWKKKENGKSDDEYHQEKKRLLADRKDYRIVVDHIDHIVNLIGIDHVGLGSDFDGVDVFPKGLENASDMPKITEELGARGYSEQDIRKILGENFMRVFKHVVG